MRNRYILLGDLPLFLAAALGAFVLRFDWFFPTFQREFALYATTALVVKTAVFYVFGMYQRYWRYASTDDLLALCLTVSISSVAMAAVVAAGLYTHVVEQFARSVVIADWLLTLALTAALRLSVRVIGEARRKRPRAGESGKTRRILVVGAGYAGGMVVREMQRNPQLGMVPIGFVDDDAAKVGKSIYGLPVFGRMPALADIVRAQQVDVVTIAMPSAPGNTVRAVAETCRRIGIPSRTMPGVYELLDGNVSVSRLRNIEIADLLRRSQVEPKNTAGEYVTGRTVLVTGAGGSIGLELCRQVAHRSPAVLVLLGHGENSLFDAHAHLHQLFPEVKLRVVVADIRDAQRLAAVFAHVRPHIVFHAAAHKHVPLMEDNPEEAVSNNVLGTHRVVEAAIAAGTERFVMISSDKAVSPSSLMGASKRLAETIVRDVALRRGRAFVVVRFGNVLGSRGSVVPTFKQQIEQGGPITLTHPQMRRFFMTIPEAVHLVLEAGSMGKGGELFVLRMGEPIAITDLAQDLIRLSGFELSDIPIVYTGIRPGEKLEESLWEEGAELATTEHPEIVRVVEAPCSNGEQLVATLAALTGAVEGSDHAAIDEILSQAIPTFSPIRAGGDSVVPFRTAR